MVVGSGCRPLRECVFEGEGNPETERYWYGRIRRDMIDFL